MSVRKRKWITGKGELREAWVVDYVDQKGARVLKTFDRKKDADAFASTAAVEVRAGTHTAATSSITVEQAGKLWIDTGERNGLERTTLDTYGQHFNLHILPYLGRLKLSELSAPLVREFEDKLRFGKPAPGEKAADPRSPAMTKKILVALGSILADAQERGHVNRNVVRELRSRRRRGKGSEARQKRKLKVGADIPTPDEIRAIVGALEGRWRPLLLTAIFTGLRARELRGFRWADIDFERRELHVRQRVDRTRRRVRPSQRPASALSRSRRLWRTRLRNGSLPAPREKRFRVSLRAPASRASQQHRAPGA